MSLNVLFLLRCGAAEEVDAREAGEVDSAPSGEEPVEGGAVVCRRLTGEIATAVSQGVVSAGEGGRWRCRSSEREGSDEGGKSSS